MMASAVVIDSLEFVHAGQEMQGTVSVAQLGRLSESLFDTDGQLNYRLLGGYDAQQRPRLKLSVEGEIHLKCQRCLDKLPYSVAVESSLLVLTAGSPAQIVEIDDLDGIPADPHTDVWALVEDEVLLAIPFAARHQEGLCGTMVKIDEDRAASPFAVLADFKRKRI
jgi:uncharacterized protein